MIQQIRILIIYFFLIAGISSCQGQTSDLLTEEQQLRKEMNDWMQPYRREKAVDFEQWIDWVENHIDDVWRHPVYKHMDAFFQQHRKQYLRLRKADLARYPSAPDTLPGYVLVPDFYVPYQDRSFPLEEVLQLAQGVGNFRTLGIADTRFVTEILNGYAMEYLKAEKHLTQEQVINQRMYGELFFVDPIQENLWQITVVDRLYALKFSWNITDNLVSKPELWVYTGKRQPFGWLSGRAPKSHTPLQQLDSTLSSFRWSLYDEASSDEKDSNGIITEVVDNMTRYYQAHRQDYIRLRNAELAKYPRPDASYAKAFTDDVSKLKEDLLSVLEKEGDRYRISDMAAPYETEGGYTIQNFRYMLMLHLKNRAEYNLTSWIAGIDTYSKQIATDIWEIQFFYHNYAVSFHWNIATDEISDLMIKTKEKVTVDRPVGVPSGTNE